MSRIGKAPIAIPSGVEVNVDGSTVRVKGPKGALAWAVHDQVRVSVAENEIIVTRPNDQPTTRALHGLTRSCIANMVAGVTEGFRKTLELQGTGYRATMQGTTLVLSVGYSHPVEMPPLEGVQISVENNTQVHVDGIDKQIVGQQAALIRRVRPPEPYHGKGIRYRGEVVRLKAGKTKGR
ncbi:MAG: 50S ribosomal protein L6 [Chloroflexi bacterium]|nr:50S ribosomal protein L6 [Chloroflexota bacterium]